MVVSKTETDASGTAREVLPDSLQIPGSFTVSAWVKPESLSSEVAQVIASNRGWFLVVDSYGAISFSIKVEDNPAYSKIKKENFLLSSHNEWTQVVGVYDQYNLHLYINGEEVVSPEEVAGDIDFEGNPLFIGNSRVLDPETGDWFFPTPFLGSLDDIRIYGRALDDWEVKAMYYASKSCFNKYCPSWRTVEELPYFEETSSYVKKASEKLNSYLDGTTDIYEQQKPSFTRIILKDDHKDNILHFLHDERNYYLSVKQSNQWNVTAKVEAFNLAATTSTGTGGSLGTINYGAVTDLSTDKMHLLPKQTTLNLDSDSAPEGYLQSFGYFDQTKWLGMVVGVTPYMDFDQYAEWNVVLLHNQKQNLHLESSYSTPDRYYVTLSQLGEEYKLIVGEEGGSLTEYALTDEPFEHFFDELKTIGFKVQKQGTFQQGAVIKFTRIPAGLDEVYEKQFTETKPITLFNKVIKVCDNDPPIFAALTVCEGLVEIFDVLENVPKFLDEFSEVLFYYQKPVTDVLADKYGSAFHIFRFPEDQPVELALYFANNMFDGRRLALELDGDYYLLSKDTSKPSADLPYLNLARISGETHPSYLPVGDLGKVKFNLPLKKQINIELIPEPNLNYRIMKITSAIPEDINLVDNLQGYVETYSSVTYKDASGNSALGLVSLAGDDLSVFVNKMKVTYAGGKVELPWNKTFVMPNVQINDGYNGGEALFFYHDFLGVDDHHYKLTTVDPWRGEMPTSGFNYEKLRLKSFDGKEVLPQVLGDVVIFELTEAEGKSIKVEFNTVNSEVTFSAVKSKAALAEVAKPINIVQSLQANLTSYRPLELVGSSFGSLAVHPLDISQLQEVMRVTSPSAEWEFIYNNPQEINFNGNAKLLVHYNQFTGTNGLYKKQADLYLLYDLNEGEKEHSFTKDDFITPLVEGKKLGLKLGNSYYWLSSTGVGFSYANLNLIGGRALTKEVKSATETSLAQVVFTTADGSKILLEFNSLERKVRFIVQQSGEIEKEFAPSRDYETMLPGYSVRAGIDNSLQIGSKQFYNCDSATTNEFVDSFFLCTNPGSEQRIFLNQPIIEAAGTDKILVWYKIKAATKEVSLHYLLGDLSTSFSVDWTSLVENLVKNNNPVVMLDGKYYLLATTGRTLDQFGLQEIGSLENFEKALVESREGRQEFRFAVHDKIISLKQELVGTSITLTFSSLPYLIVSREGFTQSNALFLSSLGSPVYRLSSMLEGELTKMVIQTEAGENIFVGRLPFGQSRRILLTNGESITLEVTGQGVRLRT
ncbi:LamG domain-containing protein [Candidatus Woesearchaeota archaeon]|nr:LamG domain-containing protein [Candidatus Woesearchaeota archaeon]